MGFADDINKFAKKAVGNVDILTRKTVLDIGTRLVNRTPVGDADYWQSKPPAGYVGGHARANWSHSIGKQNIKEFKAIDGSEADNNISVRRIMRTINSKGKDTNTQDNVHYIQNSVPYIKRLEDGHSKNQAPKGMVGITAIEFKGLVETNAKAVNK